MIDEREVGKAQRIGLPPARRGTARAPAVGLGRAAVSPCSAATCDDPLPALGRAHDAPQRGEPLLREKARGHAVGRDHEVLDQLARAVLPLDGEVHDRFVVEEGLRLDRLELERALLVAQGPQRLRDAVLDAQLLGRSPPTRRPVPASGRALEGRADGVVGELRVVAHRGARRRSRRRSRRPTRRPSRRRPPRGPRPRSRRSGPSRASPGASGRSRPPCRPRSCCGRACASIAEPSRTRASTSATATRIADRARRGAPRRPRAGRGRASRRCRSRSRGGSAGRESGGAPVGAGSRRRSSSARTSREKSGPRPRSSHGPSGDLLQMPALAGRPLGHGGSLSATRGARSGAATAVSAYD